MHSDNEQKRKAIDADSSEISRWRRIEDEILTLVRHNATKNINYGIFHHIHHFDLGVLGEEIKNAMKKNHTPFVGQGKTTFGKPPKFDMEKFMKTLKTFENENETNVDSENEEKGSDSVICSFGIV